MTFISPLSPPLSCIFFLPSGFSCLPHSFVVYCFHLFTFYFHTFCFIFTLPYLSDLDHEASPVSLTNHSLTFTASLTLFPATLVLLSFAHIYFSCCFSIPFSVCLSVSKITDSIPLQCPLLLLLVLPEGRVDFT